MNSLKNVPATPQTRKIGFVFDDTLDNPDGVQQYILTLGQWLQSQGHTVQYIVGQTSRTDHTIHSMSKNVNVAFNKNHLSIPLPSDKTAIEKLLDTEKFDVLHVQLPCNPMMGSRVVAAAPTHTKIVGTFHIVGHSWLEYTGAKLLGFFQQQTLRRFDHITCVSDAAADFARDCFGIRDSSVIPNVVDYKKFATAAPAPKLKNEKTTIVFLGRLVERKGCQYLIEAIRRLRDRDLVKDVKVIIGGKGPMEQQLKEKVVAYGLEEIISFAGFIPEEEKAAFLHQADLAIFPSTGGESFGIILIEAMAAGAGVVMGGNNVGYRTVLGEQGNHILFNPLNTQVFADKIQLLLANTRLRTTIHNWQQKTITQYDVANVGKQFLELYND